MNTSESQDTKSQNADSQKADSVDIVIINYNGAKYMRDCFNKIRELAYSPDLIRIIWLDNASSDASLELVKEIESNYPISITVVESKVNLGFAEGNNRAISKGSSRFVFLLNQDTEVLPDCLKRLVEAMNNDETVGMAEARQTVEVVQKFYDKETGETSWCSCGGCLVRREAFDRVGGFDGRFFCYAEDVDLSWKMRVAGWKCVYVEDATFIHHDATQTPMEQRPAAYYYSLRNGIFLRYIYRGPRGALKHFRELLGILIKEDESALFRRIILRAFFYHIPHIPHLLKRWYAIRRLEKPEWIEFRGPYGFGPPS